MVMDKNDLNKPMSEFDWQVLCHTYRKNGVATLPRCRLDIPLPSKLEQCHTLAHRLSALAQQIGEEIRQASKTRSGLHDVKSLINQFRLGFAELGKEWEAELREEEDKQKNPAESEEHLRVVR
jgi:hypothetical protein